jgi:hypothetical protein
MQNQDIIFVVIEPFEIGNIYIYIYIAFGFGGEA